MRSVAVPGVRHGSRPRGAGRGMAGFTLLEAIVAMVVFSLGALALTGWLSSNMIALQRVQAQQEREIALASALDLIRRSNAMETPQGARQLGDLTVSWEARPLEQPKPAVSQGGEPGIFLVGLYNMDVQVLRNGALVGRFQVRQMGWRQTGTLAL